MTTVEFRIDPADPRWLRHRDPDSVMTDRGEFWESNAVGAHQRRPTIFLRIPEILGAIEPKLTFTWETNNWFAIVVSKSRDDVTYETIYHESGHPAHAKETPTIDIDPLCEYYSIHFADGNLHFEWTRLYKHAMLEYDRPGVPPEPPVEQEPVEPVAILPLAVGFFAPILLGVYMMRKGWRK